MTMDVAVTLEELRTMLRQLTERWEGFAGRAEADSAKLRARVAELEAALTESRIRVEHVENMNRRLSDLMGTESEKASLLVESLDRELEERDQHVDSLVKSLARCEKELARARDLPGETLITLSDRDERD